MRPTFLYLPLLAFLQTVSAFSFAVSNSPTDLAECEDINLEWNGGTAPFQLLITPVFGTPRNISIPDTAQGKFSTILPFEKDDEFILTMSDATGFGTGGTTPILKTAQSKGRSCDTKDPGVAFDYQLNSALQQCRPYVFSAYTGAIQPITITAIVPGGDAFFLNPPRGPTSFNWVCDVRAGTSLIFIMVDALGRPGGSSSSLQVGPSDDSSCLGPNSPSSTIATTTPSSTKSSETPTATSSTSPSPSNTTAPSSTPVGAILGTILGALIFLAVAVTLGLFFLRRRKNNNQAWAKNLRPGSMRVPPQGTRVDSTSPYHYPLPINSPNPSAHPHESENPFITPYGPSTSTLYLPPQHDPFNPPAAVDPFSSAAPSPSVMTAGQRKAAMAGGPSQKPSRFILHTDLEDDLPPPDDDAVIELPPQYSARRGATATSPPMEPSHAPLGVPGSTTSGDRAPSTSDRTPSPTRLSRAPSLPLLDSSPGLDWNPFSDTKGPLS